MDRHAFLLGMLMGGGASGGGSNVPSEAVLADVRFIDYNGSILYGYSAAAFSTLNQMPELPSHDGLITQGWNWTLNDAKEYVAEYGRLDIGPMYITKSGKTEIDIEFADAARTAPYLNISVNGTATIDWGDGDTDTVTGASLETRTYIQHEYPLAIGNYTISIEATSGSYAFYNTATYPLLHKNNATLLQNQVYANCIKSVRLGANVYLGPYAFNNCYALKSIALPDDIINIPDNCFNNCRSLSTITLPDNVVEIEEYAFNNCKSLTAICLPASIDTIGESAFQYCTSLSCIKSLDDVSLGEYVFNECYALQNLNTTLTTVPSGLCNGCVTLKKVELSNSLTGLGSNAFDSCYSLASIIIPASVLGINSRALADCYGLKEIHFRGTTPPPVKSNNVFNNLPLDCTIYVPTGYLSTYTSTTNYPSNQVYTYVEE